METISNLREVLLHFTNDLYTAEKQLQKSLLKCISQVSSEPLKAEVKQYIDSCQDKIISLEQVYTDMLAAPSAETNKVMEGLLAESAELLQHTIPAHVKDAVLVACVQRINHYKIAGYGTASAFALELKLPHVRKIFNTLLGWEKATDEKLSWLAVKQLNKKATEAPLLLDI